MNANIYKSNYNRNKYAKVIAKEKVSNATIIARVFRDISVASIVACTIALFGCDKSSTAEVISNVAGAIACITLVVAMIASHFAPKKNAFMDMSAEDKGAFVKMNNARKCLKTCIIYFACLFVSVIIDGVNFIRFNANTISSVKYAFGLVISLVLGVFVVRSVKKLNDMAKKWLEAKNVTKK